MIPTVFFFEYGLFPVLSTEVDIHPGYRTGEEKSQNNGECAQHSNIQDEMDRLEERLLRGGVEVTKVSSDGKRLRKVELKPMARCKGPLLVILDDVWYVEVLVEIKKAMPNDNSIILTTRNQQAAFGLEDEDRPIQLTKELRNKDAVALLQKEATGLPKKIAEKVARGLGYHPQALTLAAGTLAIRKDEGYKVTAKKLLKRAKKGKGFGNLPFLDEADKITAVEVALKFSYDYLGEQGSKGRQFRQQFRALGVFAQEADFSTEAAAAVWELTETKAKEYMLLLDTLPLANKVVVNDGMKNHIR